MSQVEGLPAEVIDTQVICRQENRYIGWPSICRSRNGELLAAFSGDRESHICPWGKTQIVRSANQGQTWSAPETINNFPLDDRDAGLIETPGGALLVSWFTSLAFEKWSDLNWIKEESTRRLLAEQWRRHAEKLGPETRQYWLGSWVRRSPDGGRTWEAPVRVPGSAPHGPIGLRDGRLLYLGKHLFYGPEGHGGIVSACESLNDGRTWEPLGTVPLPTGESITHYHEPHVVEASDGTLVCQIRYQPQDVAQHFLRQSESRDGGRTWTTAHPTPLWGYPPHLVALADGRLLTVYGVRREPFGQYASLSVDNGRTWGTPLRLTCAPNGDHGYPASIQLPDGTILTVYYEIDRPGEKPCLKAVHWRLPAK